MVDPDPNENNNFNFVNKYPYRGVYPSQKEMGHQDL